MRRPNINTPMRLAVVIELLPHERALLQWNERSAAGNLGGWPRLENQLFELARDGDGLCAMGPAVFTRLICYLIRKHGHGGPNGHVRGACIPALARIGIDIRATTGEEIHG